MAPLELAETFLAYLKTLPPDSSLGDWQYSGPTDLVFGTPGGSWRGLDGFLFRDNTNDNQYIIRSLPHKPGKGFRSYLAIESVNLKGQLYNIDLTKTKTHIERNGYSVILESYIMGTGKGKLRQVLVKEAFVDAGILSNEITQINNERPDWSKALIDLLNWAVIRENVKKKLKAEQIPELPVEINEKNEDMNDNYPSLNTILFGPPGTGKTYHSINHALAIVEEQPVDVIELEPREELTKRYREYIERGQIVFTTFHQSMSYEDFIEGIKPSLEPSQEGNDQQPINFRVKPGIFKQICEDAQSFQFAENLINDEGINFSEKDLEKGYFYKMSLGDTNDPQDQKVFEYCIQNKCIALGWGGNIDFTAAENEDDIKKLFEANGVEIKPRDFGVFAIKCFKIWIKEGDLVFISNGNSTIRAIAKVVGPYYFNADSDIGYNQFRKVEWLSKNLQLPVQQIYPRKFSQQSIYGLFSNEVKRDILKALFKKSEEIKKNYVLIIDEINRGNVSQIFGELITLIEDDKRLGKPEALEVTLPYSKTTFGVPPNLYIIGTMNTADRSVEALDTALRRRFSFEEMPPQYDLDGLSTLLYGFTAGDILKTINSRIERLLDKDHLIGHAYFLDKTEETLITSFYQNIIPLLQEYFYGDYGKIGLVLGEGFVKSKNFKEEKLATFRSYQNGSDYTDREVYEIEDYRNEYTDYILEIKKDQKVQMTFEKAIKLLITNNIE